MVMPSLLAFMFWYRPPFSAPASSLRNGWMVRAASTLWVDSTRTTVAPQSASSRVEPGPAITHMKSKILTSASGSAGSR